MKRIPQIISLLLCLLVLTFTACEPGIIDDFKNPGPSFSIDEFEAQIVNALDGKVTGYAYSIGMNAQPAREGANGFAVMAGTSSDYPDAIPMTHTLRMHIASVTKPITALTLFKAMEQAGIESLDIPFVQFLPSHWTVHPSLNDITLRQLLDHTSGILESGNQYEDQKPLIAQGVNQGDKGNFSYNNANYSILRIVIPYMISGDLLNQASFANDDAAIDQLTTDIFINMMESKILVPAQVTHDVWNPSRKFPVLFYDYSDLTKTPWATSDYLNGPGAFGLYLSPNDVSSVMAHARHLNGYLPQPYYDWFFDQDMGLFTTNGSQGSYLYHNGDWISNGRGYNGTTMIFPNNVEATVMINCRNHDAGSEVSILRNAFDAAWQE